MIIRKSPAELDKMRRAGLLVHAILQQMTKLVAVGVTTLDLELEAEKMISDAGAKPAFKGYYGRDISPILPKRVTEMVLLQRILTTSPGEIWTFRTIGR